MKGYKGFEKKLVFRGKQYAEDTVFEEENAVISESGMHYSMQKSVLRFCGGK